MEIYWYLLIARKRAEKQMLFPGLASWISILMQFLPFWMEHCLVFDFYCVGLLYLFWGWGFFGKHVATIMVWLHLQSYGCRGQDP